MEEQAVNCLACKTENWIRAVAVNERAEILMICSTCRTLHVFTQKPYRKPKLRQLKRSARANWPSDLIVIGIMVILLLFVWANRVWG